MLSLSGSLDLWRCGQLTAVFIYQISSSDSVGSASQIRRQANENASVNSQLQIFASARKNK
jgi:hypothetical protein